jgi:hypothetical protein
MHGKGHLIQIALKLEPGFLHKPFIFRLMRLDRLVPKARKSPNQLEIDVNDSV